MKKVTIGSKPTATSAPQSPDQWVNAKQGSAEPMKRLTIDIPLSLHTRIKTQCASQQVQMADVIREMLETRFPEESGHHDHRPAATDNTTETQKGVEPQAR
jgi:hypothetical protein